MIAMMTDGAVVAVVAGFDGLGADGRNRRIDVG